MPGMVGHWYTPSSVNNSNPLAGVEHGYRSQSGTRVPGLDRHGQQARTGADNADTAARGRSSACRVTGRKREKRLLACGHSRPTRPSKRSGQLVSEKAYDAVRTVSDLDPRVRAT